MYVVPGFEEGTPHEKGNMRLFLYPSDDVEGYCNEYDALKMGSPHERRACTKLELETQDIKDGKVCVLRIMGYIDGQQVDNDVIEETARRVRSWINELPESHRTPRFEFRYDDVPEKALFEVAFLVQDL